MGKKPRMGGFSPGGTGTLIRQAQQMQQKIMKLQEELGEKTLDFETGGGSVKVTVNGKHELLKISIDPVMLKDAIESDDQEMLHDTIIAAVNGAFKKIGESAEQEMSKIAGGLPFGGLF